jgi:hypothetical protein
LANDTTFDINLSYLEQWHREPKMAEQPESMTSE